MHSVGRGREDTAVCVQIPRAALEVPPQSTAPQNQGRRILKYRAREQLAEVCGAFFTGSPSSSHL